LPRYLEYVPWSLLPDAAAQRHISIYASLGLQKLLLVSIKGPAQHLQRLWPDIWDNSIQGVVIINPRAWYRWKLTQNQRNPSKERLKPYAHNNQKTNMNA
jgi:hypothetical protein